MVKDRRNKTRRNKTEGGAKKDRRNKTEGGKRKRASTRKLSKGASNWQQSVMKVYKELKAKNPEAKLRDAMVEAAARKRKGML
jgi:hypothetical protein